MLRNKAHKKNVPRTVSKEMPRPTACIQEPKYFERPVSDYSDVVPLLQKSAPGYRTQALFLSATHFGRQMKKGSD